MTELNERQAMPVNEIFRTLPEQIAARLQQDILGGHLKPGEPLREADLSERFGVSRGPVREAFRQLVQQGLLVLEPNKGVRVAQNPSDEMRPLVVQLRRAIEVYVLESIFDRITNGDIDTWQAILNDIRTACESNDLNALTNYDLRFHQAIVKSHDDRDLFTLWQPIAMRMMMQYNRLDDIMDSYREHKRILDAIRARDRRAAIEALSTNIQ
ncbi:MAG: GntR family transcriptional regulator [Chloroflexi bacterium]|nr:GntR family transcriptional regulator [Chloroflexota bacterium]MDE2635871.1 GntR family transcriptional regulator [Chloroflexota bacterium]